MSRMLGVERDYSKHTAAVYVWTRDLAPIRLPVLDLPTARGAGFAIIIHQALLKVYV
jgi:hypothetical protein